MYFKILLLCVAIAAAKAGYLQPALRYAAPAPAIAYAAPSIGYAAPALARVEHLAPSYSLHTSAAYTAPLVRTAQIAPAVHAVASAPLYRSSFGYAAAPAAFGFARYGGGW